MSASPPAASAASQGGAAQAQQQLSAPRRLGGRSTLSHSSGFLSLGDVRYVAAPEFIVSSLQSKGTPLPHISLIKVPPFVAAAWRASQPHELLGVLYGENERRRILCRSVKSAASASSSSSAGASSVNSGESGASGSAARNQQQQQRQTVGGEAAGKKPEGMPHAPAPICELQCASIKQNNHLLVLQQQAPPRRQPQEGDEEEGDGDHSRTSSSSDSSGSSGTGGGEGGGGGETAAIAAAAKKPAAADVLCAIDETYNFVPRLDQKYHNFLRQRHECVNVHKTRTTIEEKRREAGLDSTATLFHFYQPMKAGPSSIEDDRELGSLMSFNPRSGALSAEKTKSLKPKKPLVTMDEDSLKVQLFQAFEKAGTSGLQLKQLAQYTQQPLTFLRSVVEEIAEPRKRASDRKTVYFLKDQYNPYASLAGEEPLGKKSKLV